MTDTMLLNNEVYHLTKDVLPCLIHYVPKAGGSHFSVTMIADLFFQGSKILSFTAYSSAKDNFLQQIKGGELKTAFITDESQLNTDTQAIIIESGNEKLFLSALKKLDDINERVVLVKNMEVFSDAVFDSCLKLQKIILSGNLDECPMKKQISDKQYKTIVLFSKPETTLKVEPPTLEKYTGYLWSNGNEGLVSIKMNG